MNSLILKSAAHLVSGLMVIFSIYLVLRGHHEPGGGFIGALVAVIAFGLLMLAESPAYVRERLQFPPESIAMTGICLAIVAGLFSAPFGLPFLKGLWWKEILPLGTPLLFDLGVYFSVLGGILSALLGLEEEVK